MITDIPALESGQTFELTGLFGSSVAYTAAQLAETHRQKTDAPVVLITQDMTQAQRLTHELRTFTSLPVTLFNDWETLPYDHFSPPQDRISSRLSSLYELSENRAGIVVIAVGVLMQKLCPPSFLMRHFFQIKVGDQLTRETFRLKLEAAGYRAVQQVMALGEFATRGELFDLFPMGSPHPFRLDFFDNELESIKSFDPDTQRTVATLDRISLLPAHEFPFDNEGIHCFRQKWRERFEVRIDKESLYQQVSQGILPNGIEYWQPLFFNEPLHTFFDYLPSQTLLMTIDDIHRHSEMFWQNLQLRYFDRQVDPMRPLLPPEQLWLPTAALFEQLKHYPRFHLVEGVPLSEHGNNETPSPSEPTESKRSKRHCRELPFQRLPTLTFQPNSVEPYADLTHFVQSFAGDIIFIMESEGRKEALLPILGKLGLFPEALEHLETLNKPHSPTLFYMIGTCESGFIDLKRSLAWITEYDLNGAQYRPRRRLRKKSQFAHEQAIQSLAELSDGKPVVHLDHGIGRYHGLTTIETQGIAAEYLVLLYANETKLYVPVTHLHKISRYLGGDESQAPLSRLGSDQWQKNRNRAVEKLRDTAAELLDLYAAREAKPGFQFQQHPQEYQQFSESFPYETTEDQQLAIGAVLGDMCSPKAMDRLVCGDVGFGKTEVAMRAAFLAVMNKKQVAILVPTTLLAQQHYEKFIDRFAHWPISIAVLSRFKSAKEQKQILQATESGRIDILIGTHKLLQSDLKWHDLGLLIVDEEHRFGVRQKERMKALRANIDILTLTATPIPRTLNMAMSGIRDLSIIATPPARRLAVKTFVREWDPLVIREAILREILRGGQLYYLHNDVASMEKTADLLREHVPEATIAIAHGQMHERELERVMDDFHHQRFNLLLCSTIIETGIDIPNANTIIIERADKFGLAQLHQLRGRVGRSYHQAYAYLLTPPPKTLTSDAKRRLEAIAQLEELGSGFALASQDLEIRGAGELLGEDQSGQIQTMGLSLYLEMLEETIQVLKSGGKPTLESILQQSQTEVEVKVPALLPDKYIPDVTARLTLYKQIATAKDEMALIALKIEIADRFGALPDPVITLFQVAQLRLRAKQLGILKIEFGPLGGFIDFGTEHQLSVDYLIQCIQQSPQHYRLEGSHRLKLLQHFREPEKRIHYLVELISEFERHVITSH